jgi:hypothetical protein
MNPCTSDACVEAGASMCAYTAMPGCVTITPRSGSYAIAPRVAYMCQDEVFKTLIIRVDVTSIRFTATSTAVTVTWMGAPATLMGPAITGNTFRVTATVPNDDCPTVLTLSGTFSNERSFMGAFDLAFFGFGCALTGCENQRYMVSGTFTM